MKVDVNDTETQTKFKDADLLFRAKKFPEALAVLDELDQEFPNVKNILYPRAMCLAHLGRHEDALELCRQLKVEFGDARADALMTQISLARKAEMLKEKEKKEHKVVGAVVPPPNVFQLDSSPPPMRDPGDLGIPAFDVDLTHSSAGGAGMDDLFTAKTPVTTARPAPTPKPRFIYVAAGAAVLLAALVIWWFLPR